MGQGVQGGAKADDSDALQPKADALLNKLRRVRHLVIWGRPDAKASPKRRLRDALKTEVGVVVVVELMGSGGGGGGGGIGGGEDMVETRVPDTKLVGLGFLPTRLLRL